MVVDNDMRRVVDYSHMDNLLEVGNNSVGHTPVDTLVDTPAAVDKEYLGY